MSTRITSVEIKQKTFNKKSFGGGYDKDEVAAFLAYIAQEWDKLLDDAKESKIKIDFLEREISKLKEVENSLFKTLRAAEETSSTMVDQARQNAEIKLSDAQAKADAILNDARLQAKAIIQKAQLRAKNIMIEVLEELKIKEKDYHTLENYRDNLFLDIRGFVNDTLEKVSKLEARNAQDYFQQKIQEVKQFIEEKQDNLGQQLESDAHNLGSNGKTDEEIQPNGGGSFFDEISS
ncbi:MAG TPA: cell division protein DivIVA [Microscillaceae bacterium]|jgi:cell division initiation protein|nr:cell division protein DivIVA [Microscillaceae bacterium]